MTTKKGILNKCKPRAYYRSFTVPGVGEEMIVNERTVSHIQLFRLTLYSTRPQGDMGKFKTTFMKISNASPVSKEKKPKRQKWRHPRPRCIRDERVCIYIVTLPNSKIELENHNGCAYGTATETSAKLPKILTNFNIKPFNRAKKTLIKK